MIEWGMGMSWMDGFLLTKCNAGTGCGASIQFLGRINTE